jgi:hypothetical protein
MPVTSRQPRHLCFTTRARRRFGPAGHPQTLASFQQRYLSVVSLEELATVCAQKTAPAGRTVRGKMGDSRMLDLAGRTAPGANAWAAPIMARRPADFASIVVDEKGDDFRGSLLLRTDNQVNFGLGFSEIFRVVSFQISHF